MIKEKRIINILVIDDNKELCLSLKELLTKDGYKVKTITKPTRALNEIRKNSYQLIILDLKMPDIKGEDLLKQIKKVNSDISVIILTAYPSLSTALKTLKSNAVDYVKKPFKIGDLRQTIENALRSKMLLLEQEEELNLKIGMKLRELRKERGLTLKQLAERTNLSVSLISQIERAESSASISTLNKLATTLDLSLKEIFQQV